MKTTKPFTFGLALAVGGCASTPRPPASTAFVRAAPTPEPPRPKPIVVEVPASPALPGQEKRLPEAAKAATARGEPAPEQVVSEANRKAAEVPSREGYFNAIMQYAFSPGTLYQVYTAPMRVTDLALEPGEKILGQPASGDVVRWILAVGRSMEHGVEQSHVYLKPTRPDLETNLAINTDRRTYLLELRSFRDTYMAAVRWHYPADEVARLEREGELRDALDRDSAPVVSVEALNFRYEIHALKGDPRWKPLQVFDDGNKTFIRFPADMRVREAPALFVWRNKETQLVNYRIRNDLYVVDRLIDAAELRLGQQDQEIVRVERAGQ